MTTGLMVKKQCQHCGSVFYKTVRMGKDEWEARRFCSRACASFWLSDSLPKKTVPQEFSERYDVLENGCWEWKGTRERSGYGVLRIRGGVYRSHRSVLEFCGIEIPNGKSALHRCDNPWCVSIFHLYVGTALENSADAVSRGRNVRGEAVWNSTLTEDIVRSIRRDSVSLSTREIAEKYGVSFGHAWSVSKRKSWKHVQ